MELQTPPQSPITINMYQELSQQQGLDPEIQQLYTIEQKAVNDTIERIKLQKKTDLTEVLNSTFAKNREEILKALNEPINQQFNTVKANISANTQYIKRLHAQQNNISTLSLLNTLGLGINFALLFYLWYYIHK
jgi:hypothetical protein